MCDDTALPAPPGWGDDSLSNFLETLRNNEFATFNNLRQLYHLLESTDRVFLRLGENLHFPDNILIPLFFFRAHSVFRAASRLATAGQPYEVAPLLRACLELALYAHHIDHDLRVRLDDEDTNGLAEGEPSPEESMPAWERWLRRDDTDETRQVAQQEFSWGNVRNTLEEADPQLAERIQRNYELAIDAGAHPNPLGILASFHVEETEDHRQHITDYVFGDSLQLRAGLVLTARYGLLALSVFRLIYRHRFEILGLDQQLEEARQAYDLLATQVLGDLPS
jgi:hypothetical protein